MPQKTPDVKHLMKDIAIREVYVIKNTEEVGHPLNMRCTMHHKTEPHTKVEIDPAVGRVM